MFTLAHELFSREKFDDPEGIVEGMAKIVSRSSMISLTKLNFNLKSQTIIFHTFAPVFIALFALIIGITEY